MPIKILDSKGYLVTMFESDDAITVHLLAEDYDTDIDHKLDEMRFHRSRVNFVNKVEPIGVDGVICLRAATAPTVYTPFSSEASSVTEKNGIYTVRLPEKTAYAILQFSK